LAHVGGWKLDVLHGDLSWTEETFRIHGVSSDECIDLDTAIAYFAPDSQTTFNLAIENAIEKLTSFDLELLLITKQKNQTWVRVICHVREEAGKVVELVGAYQDISELKKVEHLKNELVSTVSHELRTPLTSIRGSLSLLKSGKVAKVDQAAIQLLDIAERNSERLMLLINDILDMEKIRSGKMDYSWSHCSLIQLLEQSLAENELFSKKFDITYKLHPHTPDVTINVDKERFLQVMSNLLSNATKFSTVGTTVDINGELSNQGQVCVSVQDYGQGIPESFREKIFTKFSQADSSDTRKQGGTGLGLSISKSIIEHMDGEIAYDTVVGKGTTFYITLPIVEEETKQRVS